jgi:hypothetical protein
MSIPTDEELEAAIPRDEELEAVIGALVARKNAAVEGSAEYRMAMRQLAGLRYTRELAGPIIEELDPYWGSECCPESLARPR